MARHNLQHNRNLHEANRASWNRATAQHNSHKGDQAAFFRAGGTTLFQEEIELLGDVRDLDLVHLQCNAGQDTLSIVSTLGVRATGVDISDEAVEFARRLSQQSGVPARFLRSDIFDWFDDNEASFDVAFVSYGAICWLSDLHAWGAGVARCLRPGGRLVFLDFHPFFNALEDDWQIKLDGMGGGHSVWDDGVGDYVADSVVLPDGSRLAEQEYWRNGSPAHEFSWGVSDIVMGLIDAGLAITQLREYPYSNGFRKFARMRELPGRRWTVPEGMPVIPMMLGIVAEKG